jgi:hypothetical protein
MTIITKSEQKMKEQYVKITYELDFLLWLLLQNSTFLTKRNRKKTYGRLAEAIIQRSSKLRELAAGTLTLTQSKNNKIKSERVIDKVIE